MDRFRELTSARRRDGPEVPAACPWGEDVAEMAHAVSVHCGDLVSLAGLALELLIERLGFERGFFLMERERSGGRDGGAAADSPGFEIVASRVRAADGSGAGWGEVANPDYALNRAVVTTAFSSPDCVAIDDCLVRPGPGVEEGHRAVLCRSLPLGAGARGLFYLERGLRMAEIGEDERALLAAFAGACEAACARAYLEREVARLRARLARGSGDAGVAAEEETPEPLDDFSDDFGDPERALPVASTYGIVGRDEKLAAVFRVIEKVKDSNLNVCIFGESGTGKELVARAIHEAGSRREHHFVSENCGAISETLLESELFGHVKGAYTGADADRKGLFEEAHRGTLFLDEIADMSEGMQRKLLRALEEGVIRRIGGKETVRVDVRVICASNRDLRQLVETSRFRADLYYRLNVIAIDVPPLRERRGDIPLLVEHFAREAEESDGVRKRWSPSAVRALVEYGWPGNVRELRNVVRRALLTSTRRVVARKDVLPYLESGTPGTVCLGRDIEKDGDHLVLRIPLRGSFHGILDECERLVLSNALCENGWNKSRVTKALGIPRQSLYNKIAKYGLERSQK